MNLSNKGKGILLASLGIFLLSPDSLLIRLINIDLWTLMFLRGLFMGLCLFLVNFLINSKKPLKQFQQLDRYAWGIVILMTASSFFFVASIQYTSVAHTLIIVGASPVIAAILGFIFLHEKVSSGTWITIFVVVIGLIFVVSDGQKSNLLGDMFALIACLLWSMNFIFARLTRVKNMIAAMSISGFGIALLSFPLSTLANVTLQQIFLSLLLGLLVGVSFSLITLAPRYIAVAEAAIYMPLESVFGSLLVWWFLGEYPGLISLSAGVIIISAIMLNSYFQITKSSN